MMKRMVLYALLIIIVVFALPISAGWMIVTKTHTDPFMDQLAKDVVQNTYITDEYVLSQRTEEIWSLFNVKTGKTYFLYSQRKQYSEIEWEKIKPMLDMAAGMMGDPEVSFKNTGKTEKIGNWNTQLWKATVKTKMFSMDMDMYFSKDIKFPESIDAFGKEISKFSGYMSKLIDEFSKVDGYPVKTVVNVSVMGQQVKTVSEVQDINKVTIPASKFEIPKDWHKVDLNLQDIQQAGFR